MEIREEAFKGLPVSAMVIDAHTHILEYYHMGWYQSFTSNDEIIMLMDHLGINCIVTCPHSLLMGEMDFTNETAAAAISEYAGRIYGYIAVCPHEGINAVRTNLEKYSKDRNFVGLKLLPGYHGTLDCPEYDYALDFAAEAGCPVLSHVWQGNPPMGEVEIAVKKRPGLKLVMAHQGGGGAECTDDYTRLMKEYPNLYMEICGSLYNRYSIEEMVEMAGEDRVIFGSDQVNLDPRFDFGRVIFSTLSDSAKRKILAGNFLKLLKCSQMGSINLDGRSV